MKKKIMVLILLVLCCFCLFLIPSNKASADSLSPDSVEYTSYYLNLGEPFNIYDGDIFVLDDVPEVIDMYGLNNTDFSILDDGAGYCSLKLVVDNSGSHHLIENCYFCSNYNQPAFKITWMTQYLDFTNCYVIEVLDRHSDYYNYYLDCIEFDGLIYRIVFPPSYYYDAAYQDGKTDGYNDGYEVGKNDGINDGYQDGFNAGKEDGFNTGYESYLKDFFNNYDEELLYALKDSTVYMWDDSNMQFYSNTYNFIDLIPKIFVDGYLDFNLLFNELFRSIPYPDGYIIDPETRYCFYFDFDEGFIVRDFDYNVVGFEEIRFYNDLFKEYLYYFPLNGVAVKHNPSLDAENLDFTFVNLTIKTQAYWTLDGDNSYAAEDEPIRFYIPEFYTYYLGYDSASDNYYDTGYNEGHEIGYNSGYKVAKDEFYDSRYDKGYSDGYAENNFTMQNLIWTIGGLPFESFKQIWNVEFLGVNVANFVTGLLLAGIAIFIIKKVI